LPDSYAAIVLNPGILAPKTISWARWIIADLKVATLVINLISINKLKAKASSISIRKAATKVILS
jgi:hypothetical protein